MAVVCASANPDKVAEIAAVLDAVGVVLEPRPDDVGDVIEDADTLEGNARLKAMAISEATGLAALADDTGLEVDALGGAPGVLSARYAGEGAGYGDNTALLLSELDRVGARTRDARRARFRTVVLVRRPDGSEQIAEGVVEGTITASPRGEGGFGYDAVFEPDESDGRTFAEMTPEEKHAISHRGRALRRLAEVLR
ncbi:MAG: RdgB/HAM1 family non-canonical purine NTP pyrophosphatase [Acidimicrobiia bacterium]|nr:RdgB/HAM1 family non-canonical purine NTP pyrophosphatase [Acidimicrobiia bacterium]